MVFALMGFTDESSPRRFTFELAGSGPPRTTMVVVADMALVRKYEIPLQELPLLSVRLLESWAADADSTVVFLEREMIEYAIAEERRRIWQKGSDTWFGRRSPVPEVTPLANRRRGALKCYQARRGAGADG